MGSKPNATHMIGLFVQVGTHLLESVEGVPEFPTFLPFQPHSVQRHGQSQDLRHGWVRVRRVRGVRLVVHVPVHVPGQPPESEKQSSGNLAQPKGAYSECAWILVQVSSYHKFEAETRHAAKFRLPLYNVNMTFNWGTAGGHHCFHLSTHHFITVSYFCLSCKGGSGMDHGIMWIFPVGLFFQNFIFQLSLNSKTLAPERPQSCPKIAFPCLPALGPFGRPRLISSVSSASASTNRLACPRAHGCARCVHAGGRETRTTQAKTPVLACECSARQ